MTRYKETETHHIGMHDFYKEAIGMFPNYGNTESFSVNIFKWIAMSTTKKRMKRSKGVVRVIGLSTDKEKVFEEAERIVALLDEGKWDGRKSVRVK